MINSKKKAQISIEALIIVGVIIIGATIFASVYLSRIASETKRSTDLSGMTDSFINDIYVGNGWTPGDNNGGIDPPIPGNFYVSLSLNPTSSTPINTNFGINVNLNNQTGETNPAIIKEITIKDSENESTSNCSYNNQPAQSTYTGLSVPFTNNLATLNFKCLVEGEYRINVKAGISGMTNHDYAPLQGISKVIASSDTFLTSLSLQPVGSTPLNNQFGVIVNVLDNPTANNAFAIKRIEVTDASGQRTDDCSFNGKYASVFTDEVAFSENKKSLYFNCNSSDIYTFNIKTGIIDKPEPNLNDIKEIQKTIIQPSFYVEIVSPQSGYYDISGPLMLSSNIYGATPATVSCRWTAQDKSTGNTKIISNMCNDVVSIADFTIDNTYNLYLQAQNASLEQANAGPNEIIIIDKTQNNFLLFDPQGGTVVNSVFITNFVSTEEFDEITSPIKLTAANCNFTRINTRPESFIFYDPVNGTGITLFSYKYNSSCTTTGIKNISLDISEKEINITENYNIFQQDQIPTPNILIYLDGSQTTETSEEQDEALNLLNQKEGVLYFAIGGEQATNYGLNQNQKFNIKPILQYNTTDFQVMPMFCSILISPITDLGGSGPTITKQMPCNTDAQIRVNGTGIYSVELTANTPYGVLTRTKTIKFEAVPFSITNVTPNNEYKYAGDVNVVANLSNPNGNIITFDFNIYKKPIPTHAYSSEFKSNLDSVLYFASDESEEFENITSNLGVTQFSCNSQNTICTKSLNIDEPGIYVARINAYGASVVQQEIITFNVIEKPTGALVFGPAVVNLGTINKYFGVFYTRVGNQIAFSIPRACEWTTDPTAINPTGSNCAFDFIPSNINGNAMTIIAQDGIVEESYTKTVNVVNDSKVIYSNSVILNDTNYNNPNYGVHLKGQIVNTEILQKNINGPYSPLNSQLTCTWKYKLSTSSNWINISGTSCNTEISGSQNLSVGVYNLSADVKYNDTTIYTETSQFKIRECVVGGNRCQYNGVCEADGRCSYIKFPGVSMDLAKNYITDINLQTYSSYQMQWKYPPISGIGHNCFESQSYASDNEFVCTSIARALESSSALYKEWLINGDLDLRSVRYNNSGINLSNNYCVSSISGGSSVLSYCETGYQNCKKLDPIFINLVNPNPGATQPVSRLLVTATGSYQSLGTTIEINTQTENNIHTSLGENSNITIIANGLATENTKVISGGVTNYPDVSTQIKLTKLIYYSLNSNKNIRRIGLQNCAYLSPTDNESNYTQSNCSYLSLANIQSYLTDGSLISTQIDEVAYDYYYDYPQIARKDGKVAIVGPRYVLNDGNLLLAETYILYNNNINTNNWELVVTSDLRHLPVEARGNTLVFDSENNIHYSYLSGSMSKINDNGKLILINNLENSSSLPMELIFNLNNKKLEIKSVFPNPGFENSQKNYFIGEATGSAYVAQPYETTVATNNLSTIEQFKFYSQQSINLDKNWMAQIWVSYPIANVTGAYVNGDPNRKVIRISFSNDNGKHWSAPIDLISNVSTFENTTRKMHTLNSGSVLGYVTISKDIVKINESTGRIALNYWSYHSGIADADHQLIYPNSVVFDVNFGALSLSYGQQDYANYLLKDTTGQLVNTKAGEIDFSTYRKPYIISKISNDFNFTDWEYINNNCVLFNYHTNISENMLNDTSCILQYEQIFTPKIIKVTANVNDDVYGCGAIQPPPVGGGVGDLSFCFKEGTKVYTPEGYKHIETIKAGDKVYSLNEEKNILEVVTVKTPLIHKNTKNNILDLYKITLSNKVVLYVTDNHSFYVSEIKDYRQLKDIKNNEKLLYYNINNKQFDEINIIDRELQTAEETYYNLSLVENHNYLAEGVVVHNDRKPLHPNLFATDLFGHVLYQNETGGFNWFDMLDLVQNTINNHITNGYHFVSLNLNTPGGQLTGTPQAFYNPSGNWAFSIISWDDGSFTLLLAGSGGYYQFGPGNFGNSYPCLNC